MDKLIDLDTFVEGATRPGYDPWTHFLSELALSGYSWIQIANFLVCGTLMLAFAASVWRGLGSHWGAGLLAVYAIALLVAGVEVTDPPGATRKVLSKSTRSTATSTRPRA